MSPARTHRLAAALAPVVAAAAVLLAGCSSEDPGLTCPAGQSVCGSMCVDLQTSTATCGSCTTSCPAGATCQAGSCRCPAGQLDVCGAGVGQCTDKLSDPRNCGTCGHDCGLGRCSGGACDCTGFTACGAPDAETCVDLGSDLANCGGCGLRCVTGQVCQGACICRPGYTDCTGGSPAACFDNLNDPAHCSATPACPGTTCPAGAACDAGSCACPAGQAPCGPSPGACTDRSSDEANCGTCGTRCATGATCTGGVCNCPAGQAPCGPSPGVCTDRSSDEANCGTCGSVCAGTCLAGSCCAAPRPACGTTCCAGGTGCCGTGCQPAHSAGIPPLGSPSGSAATYYDCGALGTYSRTAAQLAAQAWSPAGGIDADALNCGGGCLARQAGGACATWCYDGLWRGRVGLVNSIACQCPTALSPPWD